MKAIVMTEAGSPDVLRKVAMPEPEITEAHQVKIKIHAAGVNPIDTKIRARGLFYPDALPAVLGCDGAGVIVEKGNAVDRFKVGDEVWYCHGGLGREQGNYAEFTVIDQLLLSHKPVSISFVQAAAAPLVAITAWEALFDRARLQTGQTVLIHAGAGGVGHVAIQLAKHAGAKVFTTISDEAKAGFVEELGADVVINYTREDVAEVLMHHTDGQGVDVVFDTVGPSVFQSSFALTAHYGHLVTLLDPGKDITMKVARDRNLNLGFELMLTPMLNDQLKSARQHQINILDQCRTRVEEGKLHFKIGCEYSLADAAQAHRAIEAGHSVGKHVLNLQM